MRINNPLDDVFQNRNAVRVLRQLVLFPSKVITGRGLARELGMNHATCIKALDSLANIGAISRKTVGKSSVYEIPQDSVLCKDLLRPLFEREANLLNELVEILAEGIRRQAVSIYVFGSVARAEDTAVSDVDIAIILKAGVEKKQLEGTLEENERRVCRLYRVGTNVLLYSSDEFRRMRKSGHALARGILSEGLLVYGKEQ